MLQGDTEAGGFGSQGCMGLGAPLPRSHSWSQARRWAPSTCSQGMFSAGLGPPFPLCGVLRAVRGVHLRVAALAPG